MRVAAASTSSGRPVLLRSLVDEVGVARQSVDLLAQAVRLGRRGSADRDLAVERGKGESLAHERRHDGAERQQRAARGGGPDEAAIGMAQAAVRAVERQVEALVRAIGDLHPPRHNSNLIEGGEQRGKVGFRQQQQAHRQPSVLPVDRFDPMVPVKLIGFKRGFPVHLEGEDLVELALCRKRQVDRLCQQIRLRQAKHRWPASSMRQGSEAGGIKPESAERRLLAVLPQANRHGIQAAVERTGRGDDKCVDGSQNGSAPSLRQEIRQLPKPPGKELTRHYLIDPTRIDKRG